MSGENILEDNMSEIINKKQDQISESSILCAICGSKAIGVNFGARTCAPCKGNSINHFIHLNVVFFVY